MIIRVTDDYAVLLDGCCRLEVEESPGFAVVAIWSGDGGSAVLFRPNQFKTIREGAATRLERIMPEEEAYAQSKRVLTAILHACGQRCDVWDMRELVQEEGKS